MASKHHGNDHHGHDHDGHGHDHESPKAHQGMSKDQELSYYALRVKALESALVEKGICTPDEVTRAVAEMETRTPADGARVVARAWLYPKFRRRLMTDSKTAIKEMGYDLAGGLPDLVVVENTEETHHVVVCTLCSCYPRWLLGRPPDWYKSLAYRSRVVVDPRGVLKEFGLELPPSMQLKVLDSTAEVRYMVIPRRPRGTYAMGEAELAKLVTRDSMIGVAEALMPEGVKA
ncbi:MAG: nitrile hydratase subunit alpha [SAR202 cluster bacterium]|nr:nitrile hydratase subunit alpha [SAR202 cluster bacterium]